jgi:hypothetical protein
MSTGRRPRGLAAALALAAASLGVAAPALAQAPLPGPMQPAPPPPAPFPPSLQAGGLVPPSATPPNGPAAAEPSETEQELERAKKEDSKRGLEWFWVGADGGFSYVDLRALASDKDFTAGFLPTQSVGGSAGLGLGARLLFLTLGARGRVGFYSPWMLYTVGGELGLHLPFGRVEPHLEIGAGYAAMANAGGLVKGSTDAISVAGGYGRVSGGVDAYLMPLLSVGILVSGDMLALTRPALSAAQINAIKNDPKVTDVQRAAADGLATQGSTLGAAAGVTAVLGLHF